MSAGRYARPLARGARTGLARALPALRSESPRWVFGGASGRSYSDNARVVHERVCRGGVEASPVWVIDAHSPDRADAGRHGPVVERGSLHAHRLTASAEVIFFSHGTQDVPGLLWARQAVRVRLGHGLTAFGRTKGRLPRSVRRLTAEIDLAPVASRMEQDHKTEWGFPRSKLPITGLPRWDAMLRERDRATRTRPRPLVLYAPTSRPWHNDRDASPTGALGPLFDFLSSPRLVSALEDGAFDLAVHVHQNTRYRFGELTGIPPQVEMIADEASLPRIIASASLVVSDYSSILWDALYLDTPVVFFQFDREAHERMRGSYLDLRSRLFGPNVDRVDELLDELDAARADGFTLPDWRDDRLRWQAEAFRFRDAGNTDRVLEAVRERLSERSPSRR